MYLMDRICLMRKAGTALFLAGILAMGMPGQAQAAKTAVKYGSTVKTAEEPSNVPTAHGALRVDGANLVDAKGEKYQLYGMSTHGIAWFPQYINRDTFRTLQDDWGTNCVRLAMYTEEYNGYCSGGNKEELKRLMEEGVSYATELGMYVIVDWHVLNDKDPNVHRAEAAEFLIRWRLSGKTRIM